MPGRTGHSRRLKPHTVAPATGTTGSGVLAYRPTVRLDGKAVRNISGPASTTVCRLRDYRSFLTSCPIRTKQPIIFREFSQSTWAFLASGRVALDRLPCQSQRHSEKAHTGDVAPGRTAYVADHAGARSIGDVRGRRTPIRMIERVDGGHLPTELRPFGEPKILVQPQVPEVDARADDRALGRCSEPSQWWLCESARVKPVIDGALSTWQIRVAKNVRADRDLRRCRYH